MAFFGFDSGRAGREGRAWVVDGAAHFVAGSEVLKDGLLMRYVLINLTDPGNAALLPDVDNMISAIAGRFAHARDRKVPLLLGDCAIIPVSRVAVWNYVTASSVEPLRPLETAVSHNLFPAVVV